MTTTIYTAPLATPLDTKRFRVSVAVSRKDGRPLSEADLEAVAKAHPASRAPSPPKHPEIAAATSAIVREMDEARAPRRTKAAAKPAAKGTAKKRAAAKKRERV